MIEEFPSLIASLGFPIAVTIYLLWERMKHLTELQRVISTDLVGAIHELREEIIRLGERIDGKR